MIVESRLVVNPCHEELLIDPWGNACMIADELLSSEGA
jgi:hypothetical protein